MAVHPLSNRDPAQVLGSFKDLSQAARNFHFEQDKWAVIRTHNVDNIAARYMANPDLVTIISDRKLNGGELVLLRRDRFENMVKVFRDLTSGQAAIRHNLDALLHAVDLLNKHTALDPDLASVVGVVRSVTAQMSSSVIVKNPILPRETSPLTEEEMALLDE